MRAVDIITHKRDGGELSRDEIRFFVEGYTRGQIPDYQAAAWLMAIYFRGMTQRETVDLTLAMAESGQMLSLHDMAPFIVDKHSTGGVGDKTTLVVEPIVASLGQPMAKMSGRGLGFSGGTIDKLESIPGFHTDLSPAEFREHLRHHGIVLTGQTADLAPADGKLYALRDVTATVPSLPLIASSVMSKKIAAGADAIVLDVKAGCGAFMRTVDEAVALAELMVDIGVGAGRQVVALIADMNQPLGRTAGNSLEVAEAIDTLHGRGPDDFRAHCLEVAGHLLRLARRVKDVDEGRKLAAAALDNGRAFAKFREMVVAQGGDASVVDDPRRLPQARLRQELLAPTGGYIAAVAADQVGQAVIDLGGGRVQKDDPIDHAVGVVLHRKVGDRVEAGQPVLTVHADDEKQLQAALERLRAAMQYSDHPVSPLPLFYRMVESPQQNPR